MDSGQDYAARLNRVINFIASHLEEPLSLPQLAEVAAFSPFHFHRIFKSMMVETLGGFIWRLRLEKAANLLCQQPHAHVTEIALTCGFSTPSNFSRAFRQRFGMSATDYRAEQCSNGRMVEGKFRKVEPATAPYAPKVGPRWARNPERSGLMTVEVTSLPAYHVAYIRRLGYAKGVHQEHLNAAFQQVCAWVGARDLFGPETLVIGVPHDNPDITLYERCRYDACVTVPGDLTTGTGAVDVQDLAGGKYAMQRIAVDDPAEIGEIVDAMYGDWLPGSGFQTDDRPCLEIYCERGELDPDVRIVLDFCIPVKPL